MRTWTPALAALFLSALCLRAAGPQTNQAPPSQPGQAPPSQPGQAPAPQPGQTPAPQPGQAPAPLDPGPSLVALPIRVNLDPLFQMVERAAPIVPPGVETWCPLPDRNTAVYRYNLFRDPLILRLQNNRLTVKAQVHYYMEVGVKLGSMVKSVGSCGKGQEGTRRAYLGAQAEFSVSPDWTLALRATPLEPSALSNCEITFLGYDITDKVLAGMKDALTKATQSGEKMAHDSALLRQKAEQVWNLLQQPLELAPGIWLAVNPERIRLAPLSSQGRILTITPEVQARPTLSLGQKPQPVLNLLPALETTPLNQQPSFKVRLGADLPFTEATVQLRRQVAGKVFETEKGRFEVVDALVRGKDGKAILEIQLKGKIDGRLTLQGRPVYNETLGTLQLQDLDYTLESKSWITSFGEWLFRSTLRKTLAEKANWFMDKSMGDVKGMVHQGLNRSLAPGIQLSGSLDALRLAQPQVLENGFRVEAFLEGKVQVDVNGGLPGF